MALEYSYSIEIDSPQERTFNYLADYSNMKSLHPFVREVRHLDPEGALRRYEITQSIKMMCFYKDVHVFVDIIHEEYPKVVRNRISPGFGTRMLGELRVEKLAERKCRVETCGTVDCSWIFRGKIERDLGFAHTNMLKRLKQVLEAQEKSE